MKRKCNFIALWVLSGLMAFGVKASAIEETKEYHESWPAGNVRTLEINNKFGEVKTINEGSAEITIDVVITVDGPNQAKVNELLSQLNVKFRESGSVIYAETLIDSEFKSRGEFSIDYLVNVPTDKNLNISNKYGNTIVNVLNANGKFDIQYGHFTANELNTPASGTMELFLSYGKADVSLSNDMDVEVKYSTLNFGQTGDMRLDSKYTVVNIGKADAVLSDSKYDTFSFEEVGSISATTKYTHIKIDQLTGSMDVDAGYGGIRIGKVDPGFSTIDLTNSYGQVLLGLGDAGYTVDARCDFCGIAYPEDDFTGESRKENGSMVLNGKVGTGNGGRVLVKSRYGQIKLR